MDSKNPVVFLDIKVGDEKVGRVVLELFKNVAPKTAENFRALCTGEKGIGMSGKPLCYRNTVFHKAISLFMIQGGDTTNFDGTGGESVYGYLFEDETFEVKHAGAGVLSMANAGPNSNGSQFFITVAACPHLDGKNVAFGRVRAGMGVVRYVAEESTDSADRPLKKNYIEDVIMKIKNSGNHYFRNGKLTDAASKYLKALRYLEWLRTQPECDNAASGVELACFQNLAATKLRQNLYREALSYCNSALALDARSVKAFYRRGQASRGLGDYRAAQRDFNTALALQPGDAVIKAGLKALQQDAAHYRSFERMICEKMFQ